jgi:hypothetical protein
MKITIQALLILLLLIAAPLGGFMNRLHHRKSVASIAESLGGKARLNSETPATYSPLKNRGVPSTPTTPAWAAKIFGDDAFEFIDEVTIEQFDPAQKDKLVELLNHSQALHSTRHFAVKSTSLCDVDFQPLKKLKRTRILSLKQFELDHNDIAAIAQMDALELLLLKKSTVNPADLQLLRRLPNLSWLLVEQGSYDASDFDALAETLPNVHINALPPSSDH